MRQLKLSYGVLIGSKIRIFYDGDTSPTDAPYLVENVDIVSPNENGERFVELFSKAP